MVLFTTRSYSNTTAKQIGVTRAACSHKDLIYCHNPNGFSHSENFNHWQNEIEKYAKSLLNARKPEKYLNLIGVEFNQANEYAKYFGLKLPKVLILANSITTKEDYISFNDKKIALAKKEEKQRVTRLQKAHSISLSKWKSGEINRLPEYDGFDYLRYNSLKDRIQTTQNVEIPVQIAKEFYSYVIDTVSKGGCTNCNKKLLEFDVRIIDKDFVRVGCHNVSMQEIKGIAAQLGW